MVDTLTPEEFKEDTREARINKVLDKADRAPDPEASTEFTSADQEGIDAMHQSTNAIDPMDDREAKIEIARTTAEQTLSKMEGVQPGSDTEKANLDAMREARRTGSMTVDGLQSAPTSGTENAPTEPKVAEDDSTPVQSNKQPGWLKRLLRMS